MKYIYLLVTFFIFSGCAKEEGYGTLNLKDGQEVELSVGHQYGAIHDNPLLLPRQEAAGLPLVGFDEREIGYTYKVRAKVVAYKGPVMMDGGPGHKLQFMKVVSKDKYEGDESFELALVRSIVPGPAMIWLWKDKDKYTYVLKEGTQVELTYTDEEVGKQLAEIWAYSKESVKYDNQPHIVESKWRAIRAIVKHDPQNFGKAYLVSHLDLIN